MIRHKFNAKRTEHDGFKFASKKEAKRYLELKQLQKEGAVLFFLMQVPFHIPGGIKFVLDFLVFWTDGSVSLDEVKGQRLRSYIDKKKLVETFYPVTIREL